MTWQTFLRRQKQHDHRAAILLRIGGVSPKATLNLIETSLKQNRIERKTYLDRVNACNELGNRHSLNNTEFDIMELNHDWHVLAEGCYQRIKHITLKHR